MKIRRLEIRNYRSLRDVTIYPEDILALVGRNNSGKSNVINALELFFQASTRLVDAECFHYHSTEEPIEITVTFEDLTKWEKEQFQPWMSNDRLVVGREVVCKDDGSYDLRHIALTKVPEPEWLREDAVSRDKIDEWWPSKDHLRVGNLDFGSTLGTRKPRVGDWKEAAKRFVSEHRDQIPWIEQRRENPKGYPGVLKGALPEFIFVPAVRDISEEAKVGKTNPFGQLINSVLERVSDGHREAISAQLEEIHSLLNRSEAAERIAQIEQIEERLNELMGEIMDCDIEIEVAVPDLAQIFGGAKIYANDGTRTSIERKGHGLQRSMIFTILRAYAELAHAKKAGKAAHQRTTVFAIEEPELYLHPQCQRTCMSVFTEIARGVDQVIYSTQSSLFVDVSRFDEVCIMRREKRDGKYESRPTQLPISVMIDDLKARTAIVASQESIREHYSHAFNPVINEGFFADKVVIVEGPSEQYSLPIYADALGYDLDWHNLSVVHSDGKGQMDRLLRLFNGFLIPTYVWFDGDKDNDDANVRRKTLELLELLGDPVGSIDAVETKIADGYAVLEYDFERTMREELDDYESLLQEAAQELGPTGKPLKHRFIASRVRERVCRGQAPDSVVPATIIEIVEKLKQVSYSGAVLRRITDDPA